MALVAVFGVGLAMLPSAVRVAGATSPSGVHLTRVRDLCHLPRTGNTAGALGADVGWSFASAGHIYWLFGDTLLNKNGSGIEDRNGFQTGTIARSDDHNADDCVEMSFKTDSSGFAAAAVTPDTAHSECLTWPSGGVDVNGTPYLYYTSVVEPAGCAPNNAQQYSTGIARVTDPNTMTTVKTGILWPAGQRQYATPFVLSGYVYVFAASPTYPGKLINFFGQMIQDPNTSIYAARVPVASVASIVSYTYWNGSSWVAGSANAQPIFSDLSGTPGWAAAPSIAYQPHLGRFLAVYTCGFLNSAICARTSAYSGTSASGLTSWNHTTVLYQCPGFSRCEHAQQHAEYATSTQPGRIYVTVARHYCTQHESDGTTCAYGHLRYWVTLRALDVDTALMPSTRSIGDAEADFSGTQGYKSWTYRSTWDLSSLTYNSSTSSWSNTDTVPPVIADDRQAPGSTRGAARLWIAPSGGTVEISGEVWLEGTCGDGAGFEIRQVSGFGVVTSRLPTVALDHNWTPGHARTFHLTFPVGLADQIWLRTGKGLGGGWTCDSETTLASLVLDRP